MGYKTNIDLPTMLVFTYDLRIFLVIAQQDPCFTKCISVYQLFYFISKLFQFIYKLFYFQIIIFYYDLYIVGGLQS